MFWSIEGWKREHEDDRECERRERKDARKKR